MWETDLSTGVYCSDMIRTIRFESKANFKLFELNSILFYSDKYFECEIKFEFGFLDLNQNCM